MIDHLGRHWGDWASVVGLVFSILAFVFSQRAARAAREARDSVLQKSLGQELTDAHRVASEIVRFASMNRLDFVYLRTTDLMSQTKYLIGRWNDKLSEGDKEKLVEAAAQLDVIVETVTKSAGGDTTPAQRLKISRACQRVNSILGEQHGNAMRAMDKGVSDGRS
jgi:hypothetical protein